MISKVLVANRGEIALRAFRAAYELNIGTVAVYPYEDRNSVHRLKADESYQIGEVGHPVRAYLSVEEIVATARAAGADAIYPGYGFLSENPELAAACTAAGITFVGPPARVLELMGDKSRAIAAARDAGLPVLASCAPSASVPELLAAAGELTFPLFVKAVAGGGGRGMRRVTDPDALAEAIEAASREAESAFGDPTVFLEQAVINPPPHRGPDPGRHPRQRHPSAVYPQDKLPGVDLSAPPPPGTKQRLSALGPAGFTRWLRDSTSVHVTDTTFRDAHQSLLAIRLRTTSLLMAAPYVARLTPQLLSVECWGGATYDVALRFLKEDPWERLAALREAMPNICLQMLLRGRNTVGYTPYPESVTTAFVEEATATGIDIFRIFDALNNVDAMRPAIDAVRATGTAVAEVAISYTGDLTDPAETLYTLDYYLGLAERIVEAGAHVLAVKDMAGLLRAPAAHTLVGALHSRFDLPIHVHTHDTAGGQLATYVTAWQAGATAVDGAAAPLAGTTSQPSLSSIVAAPAHTEYDTGLSLGRCATWNPSGTVSYTHLTLPTILLV